MDLVVFENDKPFVINEFREGRFDYVELASDVAETKFFQYLFDRQVVEKLAAALPLPARAGMRADVDVPLQPTRDQAAWPAQFSQLSADHPRRRVDRGSRARRRGTAKSIRKAATSRWIAQASTSATCIRVRPPAIKTSSARWPATPNRRNSKSGTIST